jgi:hypothetical protein
MKKMKNSMAMLLCALLVITLLPTVARAVSMQSGTQVPARNSTAQTVGFAGHEWYVIDTGSDGVTNPGTDCITLLAKSSFGDCVFRKGQNDDPGDSGLSEYSGNNWWYEGDFIQPNDYNDSTLMRVLSTAADTFPAKERALIKARNLTSQNDNIGGADANNQRLWPLSLDEYKVMGPLSGDEFGDYFWLRSPYEEIGVDVGYIDGDDIYCEDVFLSTPIRPAVNLNLSSVLFTFAAAGGGAKPTAVGASLSAAQTLTGEKSVKYTMSDTSIIAPSLVFAQTTNGTSELRFGYRAPTGANQYVSCYLDGTNDYYGKLADCATGGSGVLAIDTGSLAAGTYTLQIFCEQANGDYYTDFAGTPITMTLTVDGSGNGMLTGAPNMDNTRPTASGLSPSGVTRSLSGSLVVTFNEAMNPAAGVGTVSLTGGSGFVAASGVWSADNTVYTVEYSGLVNGTRYTVNVPEFQDAAGNEVGTVTSGLTFNTVATAPAPQTGDSGNIGLWVTLLVASLGFAGLAVRQFVKKRWVARRT